MNALVIRSAVVAGLGGLLFGFDTAVISGTTEDLERVYGIDGFMLGFTVATALIGTIVGALVAGRPVDRYGRKKVLFAIGVLYFVGAIGSGVVTSLPLFMAFRFLGGIGVGVASVVAPIYTAEIAPPRHRGRLVGLVQFNIVLGILLAYLSNVAIAALLPADVAWRWMFIVMAAPAAVFFLLLSTTPETPRWLLSVGRREEGVAVMSRLTADPAEAAVQVREIDEELGRGAGLAQAPFFVRENRKVIMLAVAIAAFNQLSGINAILYYAPDVFRMAGAGDSAAGLQSVVVGLVNLVATMAALTVIDRIGRRKLMLIGSIGYLVSLGGLAAVFFVYDGQFSGTSSVLVLGGLVVFIAAHAFGQGAVIWVFISEIFPSRIRGRGQSLGSLTHWVFAAVVSWSFPGIAAVLGGGAAFSLFFVCMVGQLVWVLRVMPETKGVPLEEMEAALGIELTPEDVAPSAARAH
ncbi:sugar porter family MFS transporter [Modestobacter sp. I12A-02628]|uniref:Sugar porter family MFS transporter n=1 Tax=Goekera deserti TaxID=2497753 RepID=A0A7K3WDT0_9ACTN|nr:sugar porter family MFS transporter [Goekera deserti]MPQ98344.1 sugar porter family MFS transporter [Goekera deserti]NDI48171.1 sugar porter family MFS transporter [Goekera deserti]NEL53920.1 sugar porter family MFS transporter [Goekera deserti]